MSWQDANAFFAFGEAGEDIGVFDGTKSGLGEPLAVLGNMSAWYATQELVCRVEVNPAAKPDILPLFGGDVVVRKRAFVAVPHFSARLFSRVAIEHAVDELFQLSLRLLLQVVQAFEQRNRNLDHQQ